MSYRPKHLGHVNLYVRNAEKSRQWYEDVLGLHTYHYRPGRAAFMSADEEKSHEIALMELCNDAPLQLKRQVGLNHAAFMMESLDDLKEAYARLKAGPTPGTIWRTLYELPTEASRTRQSICAQSREVAPVV